MRLLSSKLVPKFATALLLGLVLALGAPGLVPGAAVTPAGAAAGVTDFDFLDTMNATRRAHGLKSLPMSPGMHEIALDWAAKLRGARKLSHRSGTEFMNLVQHKLTPNWELLGENVGYGYSVDGLHTAFMNSPLHRANILGDWDYVGIGSVIEPNGRIWVTVNFLRYSGSLMTVGVPQPAPAPAPPALNRTTKFHPVTPARLLDTRSGARPGPTAPVNISLLGRAGLPTSASKVAAVALNVTVTQPTGPGFVTVWPSGHARPTTSNVNTDRAGQTVANQVVTAVGTDGRVNLYTSGQAHLVVDIAGWYEPTTTASDGRFRAVTPARLLDTRTIGGQLPALRTTIVPVAGRGGVPLAGASAVTLNITVTDTARSGYITAWGAGSRPGTSNLNADGAGQTIANQVIVPIGPDGTVKLFNHMPTNVIVDVAGWFTDNTALTSTDGLFVPVTPYRAVDTRQLRTRSHADATWDLDLRGSGWRSAALNVTIVDPTGRGFVTVWGGGNRPGTSTVNADSPHEVVPNAATVYNGGDSGIRVYTNQETHLLIDVSGFYVV